MYFYIMIRVLGSGVRRKDEFSARHCLVFLEADYKTPVQLNNSLLPSL